MGAKASFPVVPLSRDRVVIVTGGNTGLGYPIAKWIAIMGATVIIACRSEERALEAIKKMAGEYEEMKAGKELRGLTVYDSLAVEYMNLDLASFSSTKAFVENFKKTGRPLHVLICNAGICMPPFSKTEDGFETMLQVNYLSHFLLVAKLLPVMLQSGPDCRILHMSSAGHESAIFDLATMNYDGTPEKFSRLGYYGRSKLYQVMQTHCMTRRLKNTPVTVNCSHPGLVETDAGRAFPDWKTLTLLYDFSKKIGFARTPLYGATSLLNAAVNPDLAGVGGRYYVDCKDGKQSATARDESKQEALWRQTLDYLHGHLTEEELRCIEGKQST